MSDTKRYGHITYHFDEFCQSEDWCIRYTDYASDNCIDLNYPRLHRYKVEDGEPEELGVWISIEGRTGKVKIEYTTRGIYDSLVENRTIIEDPWPNFGSNTFLGYKELIDDRDEGDGDDSHESVDDSCESVDDSL
jgi:hypothetical protein